ncbi:MAG: glycosyltransferase family 39 protein [Candidatus Coatesbacteria bacterium]|nr:MAG: glycosyltransferase family 39 protein [Candidatus Coatesbacteria bacterium]
MDTEDTNNIKKRQPVKGSVNAEHVCFSLLVLLGVFAAACTYVILVRFGPHHLTGAFHWDEGFGVEKTLAVLRAGSPSVGGFLDWGPLYFYVHAGVFALFEFVSAIIGFDVAAYADYGPYIIVGRFVNLVASVCYSALFYTLASKYGGKRAAVFALAVFVSVPIHIQVIGKVRPDTLNMLFVLASLFFLAGAEPGKRRRLYLAAVFAALSFGVKYTGVTLLPFICLASVKMDIETADSNKRAAVRAVKNCALLIATFAIVVFITVPVFLLEPVSSFFGLVHLRNILKHGTSITGPPGPLHWLPILLRPHNGGPVLPFVFAGFAVAAGVSAVATKKGRAVRDFFFEPKTLAFLWALAYAAMFILTVRLRASRYVIPLLPFYALSAALVVKYAFDGLRARPLKYAAAILCAAILAVNCLYTYKMFAAYRYGMDRSKAVLSWFTDNVPEGETVGHSLRAYVPFDVYETFDVSECVEKGGEAEFYDRRPAAYVLNYRAIEEFADPHLGRYYRFPEERFLRVHRFVEASFVGSVEGYYLAADLGLYYIFAREDMGPGYATDIDGRRLDETPTIEDILSSPEHKYDREFLGLPFAYRIYVE